MFSPVARLSLLMFFSQEKAKTTVGMNNKYFIILAAKKYLLKILNSNTCSSTFSFGIDWLKFYYYSQTGAPVGIDRVSFKIWPVTAISRTTRNFKPRERY